VLYQLSYSGEPLAGLEPATTRLQGEVSETYTTHAPHVPRKQSAAVSVFSREVTAAFTMGKTRLVHTALNVKG